MVCKSVECIREKRLNHTGATGTTRSIVIKEKTAPVAVLISAIQRLNDSDVVFVQQGDYFEATPVVLGQKDDQWVEVVSGLDAGQRYVSKNSFFMKAELGKEGASHEH